MLSRFQIRRPTPFRFTVHTDLLWVCLLWRAVKSAAGDTSGYVMTLAGHHHASAQWQLLRKLADPKP